MGLASMMACHAAAKSSSPNERLRRVAAWVGAAVAPSCAAAVWALGLLMEKPGIPPMAGMEGRPLERGACGAEGRDAMPPAGDCGAAG